MTYDIASRFQATILCYLDAAYNYAFWLTRNQHDAEDLTQEACQRALAAFERFEDNNPRAWFLTIVRHTFLNHQQKNKNRGEIVYLDSAQHDYDTPAHLIHSETPEQQLQRAGEADHLHTCIAALPDDYREIIILRELEDLSYQEIASILGCAIGTVMSRLSRAREKLKQVLTNEQTHRESAS